MHVVKRREKKIKHVQVRLEDHEAAVFKAKMKALGLSNIQSAAKTALLAWATDKNAVVPTGKPESAILIRLDTLITGQKDIQEGVQKVLREITSESSGKGAEPGHTSAPTDVDGEDSGIPLPADIAKTAEKHGGSPKLPPPTKTDRPRKQGKNPGTGTGGSKH